MLRAEPPPMTRPTTRPPTIAGMRRTSSRSSARPAARARATVRVGRQELAIGRERLVGAADWANARRWGERPARSIASPPALAPPGPCSCPGSPTRSRRRGSGDRDSTDRRLGTFQTLFPTAHAQGGYAHVRPGAYLRAPRTLSHPVDWAFLSTTFTF